jgi:hypothetical protein
MKEKMEKEKIIILLQNRQNFKYTFKENLVSYPFYLYKSLQNLCAIHNISVLRQSKL